MNFFKEFYNGLDAINLFIFWGVIIVVTLLLIFAIIIANKNRKLKRIIEKSGIDIDSFDNEDLAIRRDTTNVNIKKEETNVKEEIHNVQVEETNTIVKEEVTLPPVPEQVKEEVVVNTIKQEIKTEPVYIEPVKHVEETTLVMPEIIHPETTEKPVTEEKFVAEEHVMEHHETNNNINNVYQPQGAYQRNVFKEQSYSQTSPIGITRVENNVDREVNKAKELHEALNTEEQTLLNQRKYAETYNQNTRKGDYLEELSKKLSDANSTNDIARTEYELKQEEDAVISYDELMQKKDNIKTVDEEDAVISINELIARKKEEDKLYNITKDEENDEFISELKHFRSDL